MTRSPQDYIHWSLADEWLRVEWIAFFANASFHPFLFSRTACTARIFSKQRRTPLDAKCYYHSDMIEVIRFRAVFIVQYLESEISNAEVHKRNVRAVCCLHGWGKAKAMASTNSSGDTGAWGLQLGKKCVRSSSVPRTQTKQQQAAPLCAAFLSSGIYLPSRRMALPSIRACAPPEVIKKDQAFLFVFLGALVPVRPRHANGHHSNAYNDNQPKMKCCLRPPKKL